MKYGLCLVYVCAGLLSAPPFGMADNTTQPADVARSAATDAQKLAFAIVEALRQDDAPFPEEYLPDITYYRSASPDHEIYTRLLECGEALHGLGFIPQRPAAWQASTVRGIRMSLGTTNLYVREVLGMDWSDLRVSGFAVEPLPREPLSVPQGMCIEVSMESCRLGRRLWMVLFAGYGKNGIRLVQPCGVITTLSKRERRFLEDWSPGRDNLVDKRAAETIADHKLNVETLAFLGLIGSASLADSEERMIIRLPERFDPERPDFIEVFCGDSTVPRGGFRLVETAPDSFRFQLAISARVFVPEFRLQIELPRESLSDVTTLHSLSATVTRRDLPPRQRQFVRVQDEKGTFESPAVRFYDLGVYSGADHVVRLTVVDNATREAVLVKRTKAFSSGSRPE